MAKYKVLDLFAGAGGFSFGFSLVEEYNKSVFEIVKAVEKDQDACNTLRNHIERSSESDEEIAVQADLTDPEVIKLLEEKCQGVDIIIGGPPCQTFSLVGPSRSGSKDMREALKKDPRNILFKCYLELVRVINPKFVVFENVEGITSKDIEDYKDSESKEKKVIELICDELEELGYYLKYDDGTDDRYKILNAADYGVPQIRKRVFIIANRLGLPNKKPVETHYPLSTIYSTPYITIAEAIGDLPPLFPTINIRSINKLKKMDVVVKGISNFIDIIVAKIDQLIQLWSRQCRHIDINSIVHIMHIFKKIKVQNNERLIGKEELKRSFSKINKVIIENELNKSESHHIYRYNNLSEEGMNFRKYIYDREEKIYENYKLTSHISREHNIRDIIIFMLMEEATNSAHFLKGNENFYQKNLGSLLSSLYPYDTSKHVDTYVKQGFDIPSKTILAHLSRDGLRFIHPEQFRTFTPREAARLQSFPDSFQFEGSMISQFRQIGNAVPPLLSKSIAESIYEQLKLIENNKEIVKENKRDYSLTKEVAINCQAI